MTASVWPLDVPAQARSADLDVSAHRVDRTDACRGGGRSRPVTRFAAVAAFALIAVGQAGVSAARPSRKAAADSVKKPLIEPRTRLEFVYIRGGDFNFGCEPQDTHCFADEKPARRVEVASFWAGRTDTTVAAYSACVQAGACRAPAAGGDCNWNVAGREKHPINCIDWSQAKVFCEWIGMRLPTADEWEFAAKGGQSRIYAWGDEPVTAKRANYCDNQCHLAHVDWTWTDPNQDDGWAATSPVGSYPAGQSRHGLLDMAGNTSQWTSSDYDGKSKQARGGGWDIYPRYLRASVRIPLRASDWFDNVSVRCVK